MRLTVKIEPKAQKRPRFTRNGHAYEDGDMRVWKDTFRYLLKSKKIECIESGAIYINITFYIYPPKYIQKDKNNKIKLENEKIYVEKRPDIDNYIKAVLDASNGLLYKDDGQIACLASQKFYSMQPRIKIEMERLS